MKSFFRHLQRNSKEETQISAYKELDSQLIRATRYDYKAHHLYIRFQDGREIIYYRVTPYAYNAFLNAESYSAHFHAFIHLRYIHYQIN